MDDIKALSLEELQNLQSEKHSALKDLFALENPTADQVDEAETLASNLDDIKAEVQRRESAGSRFADLKGRFTESDEDEGDDTDENAEEHAEEGEPGEEASEEEDEDADEGDETEEGEAEESAPQARGKTTKARGKGVKTLARQTKRPRKPATETSGPIHITAAADVPDFAASSKIDGLDQLGEAVVNRMRGFSPPHGDGRSENWQKFGVASLHLDFPDELTIDRGSDDMQVLEHAAKESRLKGGSLTAAGGWCAPSETIYDLAGDETTEGMVSLPEVNAKRGGIRYTKGPQFQDFYADPGFIQTEAQAIAGTTKPCITIDCPAFEEVRLDSVGLCIRVDILTNSAYPELVNRYTSGTMVAHQHMVNANVIDRLVALSGSARVISGLGASATDLLNGLELLANQRREAHRMSQTATLEVVLPFWVKAVVRADLSNRTGLTLEQVSDSQIQSYFSQRHLNPQWVYDWQAINRVDDPATTGVREDNEYPGTFDVLMYPAGTFVKGTKDIISLSAVYDAASLASNVYTGLFMEEGLFVAQMKDDADLIRVPVCTAGRTGAADLTCA